MQVYLVGGAVRDGLLGLPIQERDWVVVGATVEEMLQKGFKMVGKDFPVFLHPKTHEEYALARTERKTGRGYKGFVVYASPDVTLAEDLARRDLTMNAIAQDEKGQLIDPYHGIEDIQQKILKHVSPAFSEDPVRILRLARFASRFPDFKVHPETSDLMKAMVKAGEVDALVPERILQEMFRALEEKSPVRFFEILKECNALIKLFPFWKSMDWEIFNQRSQKIIGKKPRFVLLCESLNQEEWNSLKKAYPFPADMLDLADLVIRQKSFFKTLDEKNAQAIYNLLEKTDGLRQTERFSDFLEFCASFYNESERAKRLSKWAEAAKNIKYNPALNLTGKAIGEHLKKERMAAISRRINGAS